MGKLTGTTPRCVEEYYPKNQLDNNFITGFKNFDIKIPDIFNDLFNKLDQRGEITIQNVIELMVGIVSKIKDHRSEICESDNIRSFLIKFFNVIFDNYENSRKYRGFTWFQSEFQALLMNNHNAQKNRSEINGDNFYNAMSDLYISIIGILGLETNNSIDNELKEIKPKRIPDNLPQEPGGKDESGKTEKKDRCLKSNINEIVTNFYRNMEGLRQNILPDLPEITKDSLPTFSDASIMGGSLLNYVEDYIKKINNFNDGESIFNYKKHTKDKKNCKEYIKGLNNLIKYITDTYNQIVENVNYAHDNKLKKFFEQPNFESSSKVSGEDIIERGTGHGFRNGTKKQSFDDDDVFLKNLHNLHETTLRSIYRFCKNVHGIGYYERDFIDKKTGKFKKLSLPNCLEIAVSKFKENVYEALFDSTSNNFEKEFTEQITMFINNTPEEINHFFKSPENNIGDNNWIVAGFKNLEKEITENKGAIEETHLPMYLDFIDNVHGIIEKIKKDEYQKKSLFLSIGNLPPYSSNIPFLIVNEKINNSSIGKVSELTKNIENFIKKSQRIEKITKLIDDSFLKQFGKYVENFEKDLWTIKKKVGPVMGAPLQRMMQYEKNLGSSGGISAYLNYIAKQVGYINNTDNNTDSYKFKKDRFLPVLLRFHQSIIKIRKNIREKLNNHHAFHNIPNHELEEIMKEGLNQSIINDEKFSEMMHNFTSKTYEYYLSLANQNEDLSKNQNEIVDTTKETPFIVKIYELKNIIKEFYDKVKFPPYEIKYKKNLSDEIHSFSMLNNGEFKYDLNTINSEIENIATAIDNITQYISTLTPKIYQKPNSIIQTCDELIKKILELKDSDGYEIIFPNKTLDNLISSLNNNVNTLKSAMEGVRYDSDLLM